MADEQDLPDERPEATPPPQPARKTPAKKAPAKKAAAKKAAGKQPAAKKAPAKKAPVKKAPPVAGNGAGPVDSGAKQAAAQAKSTVDHADAGLFTPALAPAPQRGRSPLPLAVAIAVSLLAILLVRRLRHEDGPGSAD